MDPYRPEVTPPLKLSEVWLGVAIPAVMLWFVSQMAKKARDGRER